MGKAKKITEYVQPEPDKTLLQVRIDEHLRHDVNEQRIADGLSWQDLVEACFRKYLDEGRAHG